MTIPVCINRITLPRSRCARCCLSRVDWFSANYTFRRAKTASTL